MTERLSISHIMKLTWRYGESWYFSEFMRALRDERRILGLRCPNCRRVYLPPRPVCGDCHAEMHAWAHVQDTGTVVAFTIVHLPILDPVTQEARPSPYGMALIQLDGADTALNHFLGEGDMGKLQVGRRVRAVWREHRSGRLTDISHFEAIDNE